MGRFPRTIKKVDNSNCEWICSDCNTHISVKKEAHSHPSKCKLRKRVRNTRSKSDCPINYSTICSTKKFKRNTYIMNGSTFKIYFYNQAFHNVINTCAFDSILVGIVTAYTDYSTFSYNIDNINNNEFLKLAKSLALQNQKDEELSNLTRLDLLRQHFKAKRDNYDVIIIDAMSDLYKIVKEYLKTMPSAIQILECSKKCLKKDNLLSSTIVLSVDDISIDDSNEILSFKKLEEWVEKYVKSKMYPCSNPKCTAGLITTYRRLQDTLFIEVDHIEERYINKQSKLSDFPVFIHVNDNRYILVSIIHYYKEHYVTFIRRRINRWELHDDLMATVTKVGKETCVNPHMVMYTKI